MMEFICMFYFFMKIFMFNYITISNLLFMIIILFMFKFNWLICSFIFFKLSLYYYKNMLFIIMIIIFSIIVMNLNIINNKIFCILLNYLLMMSMYSVFNSLNMIFFILYLNQVYYYFFM